METGSEAPGHPGIGPTWTSSAKDLVTTALDGQSRIWLTLGRGIGNEIYWPSTGEPQVRDIGFLVTDASGWHEVKRTNRYRLTTPDPAVLAPTVVHEGDGWELRLDWIVDPDRDVVMVDYALTGEATGLWVLVAPHLGEDRPNSAWVDGAPDGARDGALHAVADGGGAALAVVASGGFDGPSAGFVGVSDGWQDFAANGRPVWRHDRADHGNVALIGGLAPTGTLAIALADRPEGATTLARSSLAVGAATVRERFVAGWRAWAEGLDCAAVDPRWRSMTEFSAAVLACHGDRTYAGASVASLSIPWGNTRSDLGGYHLVWARDAVESALGRLAVGDRAAADRTLRWLCATQQPDGRWSQNATPDGRPFWTGVQLDEVALPIVLAAALEVPADDPAVVPMVHRAVRYLVDNGPASPQDRWEEDAGTNAFTLAAVIAALVAARRWLDDAEAAACEEVADYWNERIEDWLYAEGGDLAAGRDIAGYYVRLGRADRPLDTHGRVDIRNRGGLSVEPDQLVALDFLALSRFGLRAPDDPRIVDSVTLIDELLAVELPTGVAYRRYNGDGYGEHDDGRPFDGQGVGRPWPLLSGERGHHEFLAGGDPARFLDSMAAMTGPGGLLPEQVWDGPPIPELLLEPGRPSGSAMPLAWAHAEFVKLATLAARGRPIERLPEVEERYRAPRAAARWLWRVGAPFTTVPAGAGLVVDHQEPFTVVGDGWRRCSTPGPLGRHRVEVGDDLLPLRAELVDADGRSLAPIEVEREAR